MANLMLNVNTSLLDEVSVDMHKLSSNFPQIFTDCYGLEDATLKSEIQNNFPLVAWLLSTSMSQALRRDAMSGLQHLHMGENGKWVLEVPRSIWTELPASTADECCWIPFDFAKCGGNVPINLLCLKDCDKILDQLIMDTLRVGSRVNVPGIATPNDTLDDIKRRVARLSMAFFTAHNIVLGLDNVYTDTLKPFHGLLQLMENPAVTTIYGGSILAAFDSAGCRLDVLGDTGNWVVAGHPLTITAVENAIQPGQNGELPAGWTRTGDSVSYKGMRFIADKTLPVDKETSTGELWLMSGRAVGAFMGTDLAPQEPFIRLGAHTPDTPANGCATECVYYYNYGTTFTNNANGLMKIVDVPLDTNCVTAVSDLWGLIQPQTLIPA